MKKFIKILGIIIIIGFVIFVAIPSLYVLFVFGAEAIYNKTHETKPQTCPNVSIEVTKVSCRGGQLQVSVTNTGKEDISDFSVFVTDQPIKDVTRPSSGVAELIDGAKPGQKSEGAFYVLPADNTVMVSPFSAKGVCLFESVIKSFTCSK